MRYSFVFIIISILCSSMFLSITAVSDPVEIDNLDGTRTAVWDFSDPDGYALSNAEIDNGAVILSKDLSSWSMVNTGDYAGGMQINLSSEPDGSMTLNTTTEELLKNGNFSNPDAGTNADNWQKEVYGDEIGPTNIRSATGGINDDGYCWMNKFVEWDGVGGYFTHVWVNQTIAMTSIPLSINASVLHNFTNNSHPISPGSLAEVYITNQATNQSFNLTSTGWVNETYSEYRPLWFEDASIFNQTTNYTFTLYTLTDSRAKGSDTNQPEGILNFWDNASLVSTSHLPEASYVSDVFDATDFAMWSNITWQEDRPASTGISFRVRTGDTDTPTDSIWSDWSAPMTDPANAVIDRPSSRYIQYMFNMNTSITNTTPRIWNITVNYEQYHPNGYIETGDLQPTNVTNWGTFSFSDDHMSQNISYFYSTDGGTIWEPVPADGDLRSMDINGTNQRIRFRAILETTNPTATPAINSMNLHYVSSNPEITLEGIWSTPEAEPGETIRLNIFFNNTVPSVSASAWLTVYIDKSLTYISDGADSLPIFDSVEWDNNTGTYKYHFTDIMQSDNSFWIDAEVGTGMGEGTSTFTIVSIEYLDPLSNRVASFATDVSNTIIAPALSLNIVSNENSADVGDTIHYQILINNTGQGRSPISWMNGTLDERFDYMGSSDGSYDGSNISWQLGAMPGGDSHILYLNVSLGDNAIQDAIVPLMFSIEYSDSSGYMRKSSSNTHGMKCRLTSDISLEMVSQGALVNPGENFVITVYFNNSGYGSASTISIKIAIPEYILLDASSVPWAEVGDEYVWTFTDVTPGPHSFTITFIASDIEGRIENSELMAYMDSTDPVLGEMDLKASNQIDITTERIITIGEKIYWPWSGLLLFALLSIFIYVLWNKYKPIPPNIDDAFLIYKDGRLISHQKSAEHGKMRAELDGDIVSAMLTAVQQFVNDSLDETGADKMRKLEFGDRELFMERGENIYIAIMYSGTLAKKLDDQITELIKQIEGEFPELASWNGRMKGLENIDDYLMALLLDWQRQDEDMNGTDRDKMEIVEPGEAEEMAEEVL